MTRRRRLYGAVKSWNLGIATLTACAIGAGLCLYRGQPGEMAWALAALLGWVYAAVTEWARQRQQGLLEDVVVAERDRGKPRVVFMGGSLDGAELDLPGPGECGCGAPHAPRPEAIATPYGTYRCTGVSSTTYRMQITTEGER